MVLMLEEAAQGKLRETPEGGDDAWVHGFCGCASFLGSMILCVFF